MKNRKWLPGAFGGSVRSLSVKDFTFTGSSPLNQRYIANMVDTAGLSAAAYTIDTIFAMPFEAPARGGVLDEIGFSVVTNSGAGGLGRIGLYEATSETNPYPSLRKCTSGTLATDAGAPVNRTYAPVGSEGQLRPGWLYWLAVVCTVSVTGTFRVGGVGSWSGRLGFTAAAGAVIPTAPTAGLSIAGQTTLPDPFPAGAVAVVASPIPCLSYHFAS